VRLHKARRTVRAGRKGILMRKLTALLAATLLAGGALAGASAASAATQTTNATDWDHIWSTTDPAGGGEIFIKEHGDVLKYCDEAADGLTPHAMITFQGTDGEFHPAYDISATGGEGSCTTVQASDGGAYDLPENSEIGVEFWLGTYEYDTYHKYLNDN
jgi:hypothetical protein